MGRFNSVLGANLQYSTDSVFEGTSDYLVNPCNCQKTLYWGTHVSEYIYAKAGREVRNERAKFGVLPLGGYCITGCGLLRHKYILHVAVLNALSLDIRYLFGSRKRIPKEVLQKALDSIFEFCQGNQVKQIDTPVFWGGKNGWTDVEFESVFGGHPVITILQLYVGRA